MMYLSKSTRFKRTALTLSAALLAVGAGIAVAQSPSLLSQALASGEVGEQVNGLLGFRGTPSSELRDQVDALNIKRRAAYQALAEEKGKSFDVVAATAGCETLATRVMPGRAYKLPDGIWRIRTAAPITLPAYCGKDSG